MTKGDKRRHERRNAMTRFLLNDKSVLAILDGKLGKVGRVLAILDGKLGKVGRVLAIVDGKLGKVGRVLAILDGE
jgi:predicted protein tyrosine phosphatase